METSNISCEYGRFTVIKSLLLSKITHVLLSPPTATKSLLDERDQMFKDFLLGLKTPKFIQEIPNTSGGLNYPNLAIFDKALRQVDLEEYIEKVRDRQCFPYTMVWKRFSFLEIFT